MNVGGFILLLLLYGAFDPRRGEGADMIKTQTTPVIPADTMDTDRSTAVPL